MILFIGGPVDWGVGAGMGDMDGDIGYRGRGCVTLLSLESEGNEFEVITDGQTDRQTNGQTSGQNFQL